MKPETRKSRLFLVLALSSLLISACAAPTATPTTEATATALPLPTVPPGRVRPAAVAGSWYPDDPDELAAMMDEMLAAIGPVDGEPIGLIVPHAGYVFSGPVAAYGFKQLEQGKYDVAVIIASDHQPPLSKPISIWTEGGFETPLGIVPVDVELAQALIAADPRITFDPATHEGEHPIEIELPFLQRVCPACSIVPVLMGADDEESVQVLADALLTVLPDRKAVVIASSDLSHYPTYDDALTVDGATLAAIETGDPARVRETIEALMAVNLANLATCACGEGAILVTMQVAQGMGADTVNVLRYANSGDSSYGNREQVVGYGAVMLWRYEPPDLTDARREELLALARAAIEEHMETGRVPDYETDDPALARRSGAFVTLKESGQLRGCIGHTRADQPLYQVVQQMAVAAATEDPRFPPLTQEKLANVTIEISVLSPFRRMTDVEQVQVGTHGLMIFQDGSQGLLLPQVPVEQGWGQMQFLDNLCLKAGLPEDCWREGASLYAFTAVVFGEEE
ncbi:MAG: AmmeMemoRadiSam system protein B [Chloroflexota bacterium]|nr:AmmeMemoRadiSam system protein B [Chloroflexota bacterium]